MATPGSPESCTPQSFYNLCQGVLLAHGEGSDGFYYAGETILTPESTGLPEPTPGTYRLGDYHAWETVHMQGQRNIAENTLPLLRAGTTILNIQLYLEGNCASLPGYSMFRPTDVAPLYTPTGAFLYPYISAAGTIPPRLTPVPPQEEWGNIILTRSHDKTYSVVRAPEQDEQVMNLARSLGAVSL
jgi:hypothetical protein